MDLMEYQVREIFASQGMPVKKGIVIDALNDLEGKTAGMAFPLVVKAQVRTGGRGKAGGVRFAGSAGELREAARAILGMDIKGHLVRKLMIVEKAEISREWYLSIMLDRMSKCPVVIFSPSGGMEIEETARTRPELVMKAAIDPMAGVQDYLPRYLLSKANLPMSFFDAMFDLLKKIYSLFMTNDCTLVEINPLAVQEDGSLTALDGKITVDDSALFRQPGALAYRDALPEEPLILDARKFNFLYIPCEPDGSIAVMSNGSGLIMSCIDLISKQGMKVGAVLDLGGGATSDRIKEAIRILLSSPKIKALFINIFGGITRCDEVAEGVRLAAGALDDKRLIIVRFEGTNKDKGLEILGAIEGSVISADGLEDGVRILNDRRDTL